MTANESSTDAEPTGRDEAVEVIARAMAAPIGADYYDWLNPAQVAIAALSSAGILATEQEWGVRWNGELGQKREAPISSEERAREWAALSGRGGTVVSRRVTAWTEVDA